MSRALGIVRAGPGVTVQDSGRPGWLDQGLSRGGAADPVALAEGAALLDQDPGCAAIEMAGTGGVFEATEEMRIALTGAPMAARLDDRPLAWNASHRMGPGARLTLGAATGGVYGYLHVGGGLTPPELLGARSTHMAAGIGAPLQAGDSVPIGPDSGTDTGWTLEPQSRFGGGEIRLVPSLQTDFFTQAERARFEATRFAPDPRSNRMGVRMMFDGEGFACDGGLTVLSEVVVPGDVQITGDGTPIVLLCECQTTGGYPRIGAVLPSDMPRVAQATPDTQLGFRFISLDEGLALTRRAAAEIADLPRHLRPLVRDPATIRDLLTTQLISGVTSGE